MPLNNSERNTMEEPQIENDETGNSIRSSNEVNPDKNGYVIFWPDTQQGAKLPQVNQNGYITQDMMHLFDRRWNPTWIYTCS